MPSESFSFLLYSSLRPGRLTPLESIFWAPLLFQVVQPPGGVSNRGQKRREVCSLPTWPCFWPWSHPPITTAPPATAPVLSLLPATPLSPIRTVSGLGVHRFSFVASLVFAISTTASLDPALASRSRLFIITKCLQKPLCWDSLSGQDLDQYRGFYLIVFMLLPFLILLFPSFSTAQASCECCFPDLNDGVFQSQGSNNMVLWKEHRSGSIRLVSISGLCTVAVSLVHSNSF